MPTQSRKTILLATDQQNSALNALDPTRNHAIAYTPYGDTPPRDQLQSQLRYNGELQELLTHTYALGKGYRMYNPVLMRFISPDSWSPFGKGGLNAYMYCAGDPVNRTDPTGHMFKFLKTLRSPSSPPIARAPSTEAVSLPSSKAATLKPSLEPSDKKIVDIFKSGKGKRTVVYQKPNGEELVAPNVPKNKPGIEGLRKAWERNPELKPTRKPPPTVSEPGPPIFPYPLNIDLRRPVAEGSARAFHNENALNEVIAHVRGLPD
ncbi:RHS repeat-associated core domain-containing protein [Pseudomonas sp. GM55]|uniref:RHS repeat-associated core domain-containing protein n=1 Tax=Pseudomonas sp. GM55 TaxID=1144333 RepID=UPI0002708F81|nr:RHS repeat-associated core domain-containing protein [Pseudomonas sp. GM55]EJM72472.1 RHS repeat-associated core domain protein-containing protein [Pseudomonas sp. GM55]